MIKKLMLIAILLIFGGFAYSQKSNNKGNQNLRLKNYFLTTINNDSSDIYVIGEDHYENNLEHKLAILFSLNESRGINKVGIEISFGFQEHINNYLQKDDLTIFKILNTVFKNARKNLIRILVEIKSYNSHHKENQISVFCFDIPGYKFRSAGEVLVQNYKKLKNIEELKLYDYLNLKYKSINKAEAIEITRILSTDLHNHEKKYKRILKTQYKTYCKIIEGMNIIYNNDDVFSKNFVLKREKYILNNILDNIKNNEKIAVFCGQSHANKKLNDTFNYGWKYDSFTSLLINKYSKKVYSIGIDYLRNKFRDFFHIGSLHLINRPVNDSLNKKPYHLIDDVEMNKFPELPKEHDLIILKNVRLANKNYKRYKRKSNSIHQ